MDDKTLVERAVAVPLLERLHRVPPDARLEYEHDPCHHSLFPVGAMCHEAATRIGALEARLEIDPSHPYDGIDARDETIRLLEQRIEALETEKRKLALDLLAALGQAADALESQP